MRSFLITFLVIATQLLFSQNLYAKKYLGVTLPFYSFADWPCVEFDGKCVDQKNPSEFGGYSIFFGTLNLGLFHMTKEFRYGPEKTIEWKMKTEATGLYLGLSHSYGWNFVTGVGEGKSILTIKENHT